MRDRERDRTFYASSVYSMNHPAVAFSYKSHSAQPNMMATHVLQTFQSFKTFTECLENVRRRMHADNVN